MSMKQLIDEFPWATTPIGARESWPQSLRTSLSICLASRFPILIWWGPELTMLYNDAYRIMLGDKHPRSLGAPGKTVWPEIWDVIGPMLDQVRNEAEATWSDDQLLMADRYGFVEECYFTFSYSPILDESGGVGGIFTAVTETTSRVVNERRLDTLRQLAERANAAKTAQEACLNAAQTLESNPLDVPFAALFLRGSDGRASRVATVGDVAPAISDTFDAANPPEDDGERMLVLPLRGTGDDDTAGFLIAGVSEHRPLDDDYRGFFALVAGHIASAIANARAYEAERKRAESLAELDRAKTAFFSNVSHEFRTPLTLMLGPLEDVLSLQDGVTPEVHENLDVAHRNALRLLKLVNALLDFSRIEAGRIEAVYEATDLSSFTADLAGVFRSAIERAGMRLVIDCEPIEEPVFVDREMWEKVVFNLLSNALKFTFEGEIEVALRKTRDGVQLSVRDTGTGIPEHELPRVFDRFHRVKGARGRTYEGSGIGLALVHELARLHGGSVRAESTVDRGSTFFVEIPRGSAHLPPERISASRTLASTSLRSEAWIAEALRWMPEESAKSTPVLAESLPDEATVPDHAPRLPIARPRILLADDNADMRDYVRRLLTSHYDVEAVGDGSAALAAALRGRPDLVLADVMMPGLDGFELLRALRGDETTREIPVLLLSARAGEESKVEGLHAGADDYLVKPFSARELLARVDAHLRLSTLRRQSAAALRESEAKFATAFGRSPLALTITSLDDGRLLEVNDGFLQLSGYTREESIGRTPDEMGLWVDPQTRADRFRRLRDGETVPDVEVRFRIKNGQELIGFVGSTVVEINGRPCVLSSVADITQRKMAEDALRESEARFREFANTAPAMLWITDRDGRCSFISRGWYEFTGQTESESVGFGWTDAFHPDDRESTRAAFLAANAKQEPFAFDYRVRRVDGAYAWVIASGRPRHMDGEFAGFVGSVIDITERKHAEQAKDEFLATLSHELRTPLTSGFGWVKLLGRSREPELLETGLHAIEQSFVNQMKLIDELLDISRIAAGKMHLEMQPLDLGSVVDAAVEMVRPSADAKKIRVRVEALSALSVRGDPGRLRQVFWNLLSNAIKFSPTGSPVDVEIVREGDRARVTVRDRGEGIEPRFLPQVFDRFRQGDASTTRRHGGLGIGLSIVASLVDAHSGTVRAHSDGRGQGATFTVMLPLIEALQQPAVVPASVREDLSLAGSRILVVDDDAPARRIIVTVLEAAGAEVRECASVSEAYEVATSWRPDLLISDLAMPQEDGYSLIRRLRGTGQSLPALAITAYVRPEDEIRVREAGFQKHVGKPFDPEELLRAVREIAHG